MRDRGNSKKFRERLGAMDWRASVMIETDRGTQEGHALSLSPYFSLLRSLTPTPRYCRAGEIDRIWVILPLFKTDEELSGRSLCL